MVIVICCYYMLLLYNIIALLYNIIALNMLLYGYCNMLLLYVIICDKISRVRKGPKGSRFFRFSSDLLTHTLRNT